MSKKLLMNNYSENGLMPVMDGLVCWLDGRDYVTGENIWRDRSGNKNDLLLSGAFVFNNQSLSITANFNSYFANKISFNSAIINGEITSGNYLLDGRNSAPNSYIGFNSSSVGIGSFFDKERIFVDSELTSNLRALPYNKKTYYIESLYGTDIDLLHLFCSYRKSENCRGVIKSVLIYNRALTEEEMQQNYEYEQSIERGE